MDDPAATRPQGAEHEARHPPELLGHDRDLRLRRSFETRSTAPNGVIHAEVCSQCHPFYTGKQKILDTGGRVARFEARFGKKDASK